MGPNIKTGVGTSGCSLQWFIPTPLQRLALPGTRWAPSRVLQRPPGQSCATVLQVASQAQPLPQRAPFWPREEETRTTFPSMPHTDVRLPPEGSGGAHATRPAEELGRASKHPEPGGHVSAVLSQRGWRTRVYAQGEKRRGWGVCVWGRWSDWGGSPGRGSRSRRGGAEFGFSLPRAEV